MRKATRIPVKKKINNTHSSPAATAKNGRGPEISFAKVYHNFGKVILGSQASVIFPFTNTGDEILEIEFVSGCDCSIIDWPEGRKFKAGESGEIKVTFDSTREEERGELEKTIDILLSHTDPETGYQVIVELKYRVELLE